MLVIDTQTKDFIYDTVETIKERYITRTYHKNSVKELLMKLK